MSTGVANWLVIWKIYHYPFFFFAYFVSSLTCRAFAIRYANLKSLMKLWAVSSAVSLVIIPLTPFLVLPVFALISLSLGVQACYSYFMVIPITLSLGTSGALLDMAVFRIGLRQSLNKGGLQLVLGINVLVAAIANGIILASIWMHPVEIVAHIKVPLTRCISAAKCSPPLFTSR